MAVKKIKESKENVPEYLWGLVCSNRINQVKKYFENGGRVDRKYQRFGSDHSLIMGAIRNGFYEMASMLADYGETVLPEEEKELLNKCNKQLNDRDKSFANHLLDKLGIDKDSLKENASQRFEVGDKVRYGNSPATVVEVEYHPDYGYDYCISQDDGFKTSERNMWVGDPEYLVKDEEITEDTVKKSNGKWVNRGDTGEEHGEFKTKKAADAQRKAMFARGYKAKESLSINENAYDGMVSKELLRNTAMTLEDLADFMEDNDLEEIRCKPNTYRIGYPFIGYRAGYIDLTSSFESYLEDSDFDENLKREDNLNESMKDGSDYEIVVDTGLRDAKSLEVLDAVIGQLSDGIWENSPRMKKYWENLETEDGKIYFNVLYYDSPFRGKSEQELRKWYATKIKQIVKQEIDDGHSTCEWRRDNDTVSNYLDYHSGVTVADAYRVYDTLLNRKNRSANESLMKEALADDFNKVQADYKEAYGKELDLDDVPCVIARDKFLSGWGQADGQTAYQVVLCADSSEAANVELTMKRNSRNEHLSNIRRAYEIDPRKLRGVVSFKIGRYCPAWNGLPDSYYADKYDGTIEENINNDEPWDDNLEFWYEAKHGIGPGTLPKGVKVLDTNEPDINTTYIRISRPLSYAEENEFEVYPCDNPNKKVEESVEMKETIGDDIKKYQEWVDYDMKHYGRISKKTKNLIDKAGLSVVKDQYGEYEVIAYDTVK